MPKDQTTKWREAKQRYRAKLKETQGQQEPQEENDSETDFWAN